MRTRCGKNEKNKKINKEKKTRSKSNRRGRFKKNRWRRTSPTTSKREQRRASGGKKGEKGGAQEVRPFLQMEKYYSHYRGAAKVWPSRSFPFNTDLREKLATWGIENCVLSSDSFPQRNILSKSRHRQSIKITRLGEDFSLLISGEAERGLSIINCQKSVFNGAVYFCVVISTLLLYAYVHTNVIYSLPTLIGRRSKNIIFESAIN